MLKNNLDWKYFNWQEFQTLCIAIAEMIVPDCNFSEYLKPGQKQDGIDLISFKRKEGKFFCIQCKREKSLSKSDLQNIVTKFQTGDYLAKSSHFVIATSADLQDSELQKFITDTTLKLYNEYFLIFECWDVSKIEANLRKRYDLVEAYFSVGQAEEFCYPQLRYNRLHKMPPLLNYIPRKLIRFIKKEDNKDFGWNFSPVTTFNLIDLITQDRARANRICIIGDAYQGKSSYIKQTVSQLQSDHLELQPIFLQIKDYNVQPIPELLSKIYGEWRNIPLRDLILVIDGLDEVPTEKFTEMIHYINEFSLAYCPISIIFSCRKLFYSKYNVSAILHDFDTYDLYSLQHNDVEYYLNSILGNLSENFKTSVSLAGISSFFYHPFYLINIVEDYLRPPHQLPGSKAAVIDSLINKSFDLTKYRKLKGSESVKDEVYQFNNVIENFAFALQLAGLNSFTSEIIPELFTTDERLLLQHNSLITHSESNWGFVNALFQEHIAARKLSKMNYESILNYCTVGTSVKKVRTKWIQTLSSLISLLNIKSDLYQKVFDLLETDNIELLFETESSKYDEEIKLMLLKKLMQRSIRLNIRTLLIYEDTVGYFIQKSLPCKDYLLNLLCETEITSRVKIVCCRILRYSILTETQQKRYSEYALSELSSITDTYYASNLIKVLSTHKFGDAELILKLISLESLNLYHEYRNEVYELIISLNLADDFYGYGLDGLSFLASYNKEISHGGSEYNLQEFLLSASNPANLSKLIRHFKEDGWISYYERHSITGKDFMKKIFAKLISYFNTYPYVIFPVAELILDLGRKYMRDSFREIDEFLNKTQSHWLIVRILIDHIFKDNNWEIGSLITPDTYDYILFEFEEENYEVTNLWNCVTGLRYKGKEEIADNFYQLCIEATETTIINKGEISQHELYLEAEKRKYENDLIYIKSQEAFKEGLIKYFSAYGSNIIDENDLYLNLEDNLSEIRRSADSYFLYYFLVRRLGKRNKVSLNECLNKLNQEGYFEIFQAEEIINYHKRTDESDKILLPILKNYYDKNLPTADFKNCTWTEGNTFHWKTKEFRLGEIFKKFSFDTPEEYLTELVWLDNEGTRGFETAKLNKYQSISQIILEKLSPTGKIKFRNKIVQNIKSGIKNESVLGTHISLCRHLKITEAIDSILECLKDISNELINKSDAIDIYLELGGDPQEILSILKSYSGNNDYFLYFLTLKLYKTFPDSVANKIREVMTHIETTGENKIKYALVLAEMGEFSAFAFLVNEVRKNKKSPYHIQGSHSISKINTKEGLAELSDIMYLVVDKEHESGRSFHDTAKSIILEWLNIFAAKSEEDMIEVITFLEDAKIKLSKEYEAATDLNWYINRMLEDFRGSDKTVKTIPEIKKILPLIDV